jgi:hypothetical protein
MGRRAAHTHPISDQAGTHITARNQLKIAVKPPFR